MDRAFYAYKDKLEEKALEVLRSGWYILGKEVEEFEQYTIPYIMTFEECDDYENCTRLFGYPNDWNYQDEPRKLFMQFDPLDNEIGFLDSLDGLLYFFFNKEFDLSSIELHEEYS